MNFRAIAFVMGTLLLVTGGALLIPALCAAIYGEGDLVALLVSAVIAVAIGLPLRLRFARDSVLETGMPSSLPPLAGSSSPRFRRCPS